MNLTYEDTKVNPLRIDYEGKGAQRLHYMTPLRIEHEGESITLPIYHDTYAPPFSHYAFNAILDECVHVYEYGYPEAWNDAVLGSDDEGEAIELFEAMESNYKALESIFDPYFQVILFRKRISELLIQGEAWEEIVKIIDEGDEEE